MLGWGIACICFASFRRCTRPLPLLTPRRVVNNAKRVTPTGDDNLRDVLAQMFGLEFLPGTRFPSPGNPGSELD